MCSSDLVCGRSATAFADEVGDDDMRIAALHRPGAEPPIGTKGGILLYELVCIRKKNKQSLDQLLIVKETR